MNSASKAPPLATRLVTERLELRPPRPGDVPELRRVLRKNAEHLRPWSRKARSGEDPTSLTALSKAVLTDRSEWRQGKAFAFLATARELDAPIMGRLALTNVTRGALEGASLGYWIDMDRQSKGLTTEAVRAVLDFAFGPAALHRVQVNVMPRNIASLRVIEKLGLRNEGLAVRLLQIAGEWEDHLMFAVTAEEWNPRAHLMPQPAPKPPPGG